jgi:hypothetical protein
MNRRLVAAASRLTPLLARPGVTLLKLVTVIWAGSLERYRPENHYMRGPGPKWHEKYGSGRAGLDPARAPMVNNSKLNIQPGSRR